MRLIVVPALAALAASLLACNDGRASDAEADANTPDAEVDVTADAATSDATTSDATQPDAADPDVIDEPGDGCNAPAPFCVEACVDDFLQPALCLIDRWVCPPGTQPLDGCGSEPVADCEVVRLSDIPGVRIDVSLPSCRISRARALEEGVTFTYTVTVEDTLELVPDNLPGAGCVTPDDNGVQVLARIDGQGGSYCECDFGRCPGPEPVPVTLQEGAHTYELSWPGRSWNGPSDTGMPLGDPFELGVYLLDVRVAYLDGDGDLQQVQARTAASFELVP